ncbi:MAG TPA: PIN domain-containing protein [Thermoanaerobaculia bacterium]|jgi:predicted nucleic acid-binding protein|nr:PIN domain-containing protein [Thermoanaerobaculia bacterium]
MRRYFVDTWYLVALADRHDSDHRRATHLDSTVSHSQLITHDAVFTEFLTYFANGGRAGRLRAVEFTRKLLTRPTCRVERASDLFAAALDLYSRRPDKEYSLVDCMSMTLMRERGITHVLTNDHHFRQEGFTVVNE